MPQIKPSLFHGHIGSTFFLMGRAMREHKPVKLHPYPGTPIATTTIQPGSAAQQTKLPLINWHSTIHNFLPTLKQCMCFFLFKIMMEILWTSDPPFDLISLPVALVCLLAGSWGKSSCPGWPWTCYIRMISNSWRLLPTPTYKDYSYVPQCLAFNLFHFLFYLN